MSGTLADPPIILHHTPTDNNEPALLFAGETAVAVGPTKTRMWFGDGTTNRLVLSTDPIDNPLFNLPPDLSHLLELSGGRMSGAIEFGPGGFFIDEEGDAALNTLALANDATLPHEAVTLSQLLEGLNNAGASVQAYAPAHPATGKPWFDTTEGQLYIFDGARWIIAVNPPLPDMSTFVTYERINEIFDERPALPIGTVIDFAGDMPPSKWLPCDGRELSRISYAALFAVLGVMWGAGDGSTTFNVPDFRGRAVIGLDSDNGAGLANRVTSAGSGIDSSEPGRAGGSQYMHAHSHTGGAHSHGISQSAHQHLEYATTTWYQTPGTGFPGTGGWSLNFQQVWSGGANASISIDNGGNVATTTTGAGASQNMPPVAVCPKIIYAGV